MLCSGPKRTVQSKTVGNILYYRGEVFFFCVNQGKLFMKRRVSFGLLLTGIGSGIAAQQPAADTLVHSRSPDSVILVAYLNQNIVYPQPGSKAQPEQCNR